MRAQVALVADNDAGDALQSFSVSVFEAPQIVSVPDLTYLIGVPYRYDADGRLEAMGSEPMDWLLSQGPESMVVDTLSGELLWVPSETAPVDVAVKARNAYGEDVQTFTLRRAIDEPPHIAGPANQEAAVMVPYRYDADGFVDVAGVASGETVQLVVIDGPEGFLAQPQTREIGWLPQQMGAFEVTLALTAPDNRTLDSFSYTITVTDASSEGPAAAATTVVPSHGQAPLAVVFDASGSRGGDNVPILQYTWQSGDGALLRTTEQTISYTYASPGGFQTTDATGSCHSCPESVALRRQVRRLVSCFSGLRDLCDTGEDDSEPSIDTATLTAQLTKQLPTGRHHRRSVATLDPVPDCAPWVDTGGGCPAQSECSIPAFTLYVLPWSGRSRGRTNSSACCCASNAFKRGT